MTLRQQWLVVAAIVLVVVAGLGVGTYAMHDELFPVEVGSKAPDFAARSVDGDRAVRTLADYRGKVLVLNIWATWCIPCIVEMPSFERLKQQIADTNLKIVAVSIDQVASADSVRAFARNLGVTFEVLLDSTVGIARTYQATGYPETFIIASDGTIRNKWIGERKWDSPLTVGLIRGLLGAPRGQ
jgi:cytochrome c biogenesis protein CcmG, thiol:disulfide interchange protein DsbE